MALLDGEPAAADPLTAFTKALNAFRHSHTPTDSLKQPKFDWSLQDHYEEFNCSGNLWTVGTGFRE